MNCLRHSSSVYQEDLKKNTKKFTEDFKFVFKYSKFGTLESELRVLIAKIRLSCHAFFLT